MKKALACMVLAMGLGLGLGGCATSHYQCFCKGQRIPFSKDVVDRYRAFQSGTVGAAVDKEAGVYSDSQLQALDDWLTEHNCSMGKNEKGQDIIRCIEVTKKNK